MKLGVYKISRIMIFPLVLLGTACEEDKDRQCVISEALITYEGSGRVEPYLKELYTFDGANYSRIVGFRYNQASESFPEVPDYEIHFSYDDGRLVKMRTEYPNSPDNAEEYLYSYALNGDVTNVTQVYRTLQNELVTFENVQVMQQVENPGN